MSDNRIGPTSTSELCKELRDAAKTVKVFAGVNNRGGPVFRTDKPARARLYNRAADRIEELEAALAPFAAHGHIWREARTDVSDPVLIRTGYADNGKTVARAITIKTMQDAARISPVPDRGMSERDEPNEFHIRVDGGDEVIFVAKSSMYSLAVLEAFGALGMPYPCTVEIWTPGNVAGGYGPYFYRIDDFVDNRGNVYGCPAVMVYFPAPSPGGAG